MTLTCLLQDPLEITVTRTCLDVLEVTLACLLQDPLEITVTRTCLDVLTELQESLANALELTAPVADETDAHFLIRNQLDQQAVVLTNGQYTVSGPHL